MELLIYTRSTTGNRNFFTRGFSLVYWSSTIQNLADVAKYKILMTDIVY